MLYSLSFPPMSNNESWRKQNPARQGGLGPIWREISRRRHRWKESTSWPKMRLRLAKERRTSCSLLKQFQTTKYICKRKVWESLGYEYPWLQKKARFLRSPTSSWVSVSSRSRNASDVNLFIMQIAKKCTCEKVLKGTLAKQASRQ